MGRDRAEMGKDAKKGFMTPDESYGSEGLQIARLTMHPELRVGTCLNLGCGFTKFKGENWVNVDKYDIRSPDVVWDLDTFPYPWQDETFNYIFANHVMEHLQDWWKAFIECSRLLRPFGTMEIRVPDESSSSATGIS